MGLRPCAGSGTGHRYASFGSITIPASAFTQWFCTSGGDSTSGCLTIEDARISSDFGELFDTVLIEQVLLNLLENACHYTPADTPVDLTGWSDNNRTVTEVLDHGPGLAVGDEQRIFEKFQRGVNAKADS